MNSACCIWHSRVIPVGSVATTASIERTKTINISREHVKQSIVLHTL